MPDVKVETTRKSGRLGGNPRKVKLLPSRKVGEFERQRRGRKYVLPRIVIPKKNLAPEKTDRFYKEGGFLLSPLVFEHFGFKGMSKGPMLRRNRGGTAAECRKYVEITGESSH